jgi:hypothetical protein
MYCLIAADAMGVVLEKKLSHHWLCVLDKIGATDDEASDDSSTSGVAPSSRKSHRLRRSANKKHKPRDNNSVLHTASSSRKPHRNTNKKHKSNSHSSRPRSKQSKVLSTLDENSDIKVAIDAPCILNKVESDLETTSDLCPQGIDNSVTSINSKHDSDSGLVEDLQMAKTETDLPDFCDEMEFDVNEDDKNILEDLPISDNKTNHSKSPKEILNLACKFCLKPFNKGKNPLMNLQKHIMKRCSKLQQIDGPVIEDVQFENDGSVFSCCFCQKLLSTKYNRDRHVEACSKNPANKADLSNCSVELFYCEDCNWPTRTELDLHKHRVQNHGGMFIDQRWGSHSFWESGKIVTKFSAKDQKCANL